MSIVHRLKTEAQNLTKTIACRVFLRLPWFLAAALLPATTLALDSSALQQELNRLISQRLSQSHIDLTDEKLEVNLSLPAIAANLPDCDRIEIENQGDQWIGAVRFKISCNQPIWQLYVGGRVSLFYPVVVLRQPLSRGQQIASEHISLVERDLGREIFGYFVDPSEVIGWELSRNLKTGTVLNANALEAPTLVNRGDQVMIQAQLSGLSVSMLGEAMISGQLGKQIRVRNLSSGDIIKATVTGPQTVEVNLGKF